METIAQRIANLSPEKRALLMSRLKQLNKTGPQALQIPRRSFSGPAPLSFNQLRLWFLDRYEPDNCSYNIPAAFRLKGQLNIKALEMSINEVVRRHEILRTTIVTTDGQPSQVIWPAQENRLPVIDLSSLPAEQAELEVKALAMEEAHTPFDLERGPLMRTALIQSGPEDFVLFLTMHHIITDGWSSGILLRELSILYKSFKTGEQSPLPELPIQYADFACWQRERLSGEVLENGLAYWQEQLDGAPTLLNISTDRPRPAVSTNKGAHQSLSLSKPLSEALKLLSRQAGATLFMTLMAAFQTLLHRYTAENDICVGTPIAGRRWHETQGLIGFFVNTLVIRGRMSDDPTFRELLAQVRHTVLDAFSHQDVPFEQVVDMIDPVRNASHAPLVQTLFVLQDAAPQSLDLPGLSLSYLSPYSGSTKFDLTLGMKDYPMGLTAILEYNADLFDDSTIQRMLSHFRNLLESIAANPYQRLSELALISEEEMRLLDEWSAA
jgi:hypothetical protein